MLDCPGGVRPVLPLCLFDRCYVVVLFVCRGLVEGCYAIWSWRGPTDPGTWELSGYQVNCRAARTPRNVSRGVPPRGYRRLGFSPWPQFESGFTCNRWRLPPATASCRGVVEGLGLLSGLVSAIRRAEVLRHAEWYRELSTTVGTAGNDPSQTWQESAITGICTSPLAATQHHPRLLAPARQLVRRRDQRLRPRRFF